MINDSPYPNSFFVHKALRELELAIAMPGNIEYLRDLPSSGPGALSFTMAISAFIDAIEGKRPNDDQ